MNENNSKLTFRNHPIIILRGMFRPILVILIIFSNSIDDIIRNKGNIFVFLKAEVFYVQIAIVGVFLLCILIGAYQVLIWKNTFVTIDDKEIIWLKKGLFVRKKKQSSLSNISNINSKASLIERIFHINMISLDLNSSETAGKADYKIWLAGDKAYEFKEILNKRIRLYNSDRDEMEKDFANEKDVDVLNEVSFMKEFSIRESFRHILLNESVIFLAFLAIAGTSIPVVKSISDQGTKAILLSSAVVFIGMVINVINAINSSFGFKVARRGENLYVSSGFTSKNSYSIPIRNIVSISSRQSLLSRILGYKMIAVQAVGIKADKSSSKGYISLIMKKNDFNDYIKQLLPEISLIYDFHKMPLKTLKYYLIRNVLFVIPVIAILIYFDLWFLGLGPAFLFILAAILQYYTQKIYISDNMIAFRNGLLSLTDKTVQFSKIESIKKETDFIANIMGLSKLSISLRGALGERKIAGGWFNDDMFEDIIRYYQNGEK